MNMTVGKLKELLEKIPDQYEIVMHGTTATPYFNTDYLDNLEKLVISDNRLVLTTESHYKYELKYDNNYVPVEDLERDDR